MTETRSTTSPSASGSASGSTQAANATDSSTAGKSRAKSEQNASALTTVEKLQSLRWAIASNAANTIFVQFTFFGTVFVLFLNDLGFSKTDIGFVLSFTPFAGLIALFVAPRVAQFGYKRTFVTFWTLRKIVTSLLLFTPLVAAARPELAFIFVATITAVFSLLRATAETGRFPWTQEIVPSSQQGKFAATNNIFATLLGIFAVAVAGYVIATLPGLSGYMTLIGVGVLFGFLSAWLMGQVRGGAPLPKNAAEQKQRRDLGTAIGDTNFRRYLIGAGLVVIATTPLNSFVPLYMQEEVGLSAARIVWLQTGTLVGAMLTSYLWGWAADRYGSQPIMLTGVGLKVLYAVGLLVLTLLPDNRLVVALLIVAIGGVAEMGWAIGSVRLLFVGVVPPEKKSDYMALYFAVIGVIGGLSQMFSGRILDYSQVIFQPGIGITGAATGFQALLTPFLPLFVISIAGPILARSVLSRIELKENLTVGQFLGIFFRGNPFLAMTSLIRYSFARSEDATILNTERLGQARSVLAIDELLEALDDPRFNVRFEAIIAASRMAADPRIQESLLRILNGSTPALSVIAAWALGRIGDTSALPGLRAGLDAEYHSIRAHSARALGTLEDETVLESLRERFHEKIDGQWADPGLRMAYASALGKMQDEASVAEMLNFLEITDDPAIRLELALALARIIGDEPHFIQLQRQIRADRETALSQSVAALHKVLNRIGEESIPKQARPEDAIFLACAEEFAREDFEAGAESLAVIIRHLLDSHPDCHPDSRVSAVEAQVLTACVNEFANDLDTDADLDTEFDTDSEHDLDADSENDRDTDSENEPESDSGDVSEWNEYFLLALHTVWVAYQRAGGRNKSSASKNGKLTDRQLTSERGPVA